MEISRRTLMVLTAAAVVAPSIPVIAAPQKLIGIEHLYVREFGEIGNICGGFVRGHIDPLTFARRFVATTDEDDLALLFGDEIFDEETGEIADEEALVQSILADVRHVHAEREYLGEEEDSDWLLHTYDKPGTNTFPATHFSWT